MMELSSASDSFGHEILIILVQSSIRLTGIVLSLKMGNSQHVLQCLTVALEHH